MRTDDANDGRTIIRRDQTDAFYREELNTTIANIEAIRAATNIDPNLTDLGRDACERDAHQRAKTPDQSGISACSGSRG